MSTNNLSSPASGRFSLSAAALHILAMVLMLMDHLWATLLPAQDWLTCAGRLAFPIFAFMAVEGYFHTHSFRKYALRLALFAVLSEVPFDLMYGGTWFYPVHQNVIWTLLLGLLGIHLMETVRKKQKTWLYLLTALLVVLIGTVLGTLSMVDRLFRKQEDGMMIRNILMLCVLKRMHRIIDISLIQTLYQST